MIQTAANPVDHVLPDVELRQWVVTPPFELFGLLLADLELLSAFIRIAVTSIFRHIKEKARASFVEDGQCGAVTFIQRWSSALGVFPHLHILVLDGLYSEDREEAPRFHPVSAATERDEVRVSAQILDRVAALLRRRGLVDLGAADHAAREVVRAGPPGAGPFLGRRRRRACRPHRGVLGSPTQHGRDRRILGARARRRATR